MRSSLLVLSAAALAATVQAGLSFGACPTVTSIAFDNTMETSRTHKLLYLDASANGYVNMAKKWVSSLPDLKCFDLGSFPYDSPTYTSFYIDTTLPTYTRMVYFDSATGTEVQYACMDYKRALSLVTYVTGTLGVAVPAWILKIAANVFRFFHFDGVMILSDQLALTAD